MEQNTRETGRAQQNKRKTVQERRAAMQKRHQRQKLIVYIIFIVALLAALIFLLWQIFGSSGKDKDSSGDTTEAMLEVNEKSPEEIAQEERQELIAQADRLAAGYDYDAAIALIQGYEGYDTYKEMTDAVAGYEAIKSTLVKYDPSEVTHIFYHSLIADTSLAFDGDSKERGYNQVMTTIDEFNKITQEMYDRGFVLVSIHDLGHIEVQEDGTEVMVPGEIWMPEGKKPFVLSQDDVSYYHYMDGDGFADRIVIDEDGKPTCEYTQSDGTVVTGSYDMIPLIDDFIEEHPDASYRGAKGIIALTGYNGILGYRTNPIYGTVENLDSYQKAWLDAHPDYDYEQEYADARAVVEAMKADGWEFASHSYGHRYYGQISDSEFASDTARWDETVRPLLGDTDIMIFAFGNDIGDWHPYSADNSRFHRLKELGFDYFCNVDSSEHWVQFGSNYIRQGRRNLDGNRMWEALSGGKDRLSDLFDVKEVFDPARPTPVE